ncbi:MAG: 3-methyladenine DNA glycosylase [Puniceicoccaceae bacterium MED-G30]|jgi:DNA-3-methyladenine glycosylase|nr:MAG: 3-methyladenine DNA glycosylase [Puniceicoccaceae bacterium MED-G30]
MAKVLNRSYFSGDTSSLARDLLGTSLCRRLPSGKILRSRITETEAYDGFEDRASHAHRGPTPRNVVMFGSAGHSYIYLCYGVHWLLNIVTREKGYPAAILIRSVEPVNGPGRLTRHFHLNGSDNDRLLCRANGLWVEDDGYRPEAAMVRATPRIGVNYAGPEWSAMPWRFVWEME